MSFKEPLLFVFVILISVSGIAGAADLEHRPGPSLVIRDKGVSEPVCQFIDFTVQSAEVVAGKFD